jgi:hypothetical protein
MLKTRTTLFKSLIHSRSSFKFFHSSATIRTSEEAHNRIAFLENKKESLRERLIELSIKEHETNEKTKTLDKEQLKINDETYDCLEKHAEIAEDLYALKYLQDFPDSKKEENILKKYRVC